MKCVIHLDYSPSVCAFRSGCDISQEKKKEEEVSVDTKPLTEQLATVVKVDYSSTEKESKESTLTG